MLSEEEIGRNVAGIRRTLESLLQPGAESLPPPTILNNLVRLPDDRMPSSRKWPYGAGNEGHNN